MRAGNAWLPSAFHYERQGRASARGVAARAQQGNGSGGSGGDGEESDSSWLVFVVAVALAAACAVTVWRVPIEDLLYGGEEAIDGLTAGYGGFGLGDAAGAALWAAALWFVTPLQLLLLFLGKIETERPSDEIISLLGRAAGLDVDAVGYEAPAWARAVAAAACVAGGVGLAALFSLSLGDATWAVSSGIGALFAAAVYEVGRPARVSGAEAVQLEEQWQEFARFADRRLQRGGRCHESEVWAAYRREPGASIARRSQDAVPDATLRTMVVNWHPEAQRTRTGFYKNLSVKPYVDAFTGKTLGMSVASSGGAGSGAEESREA